MKVSGSQPLEPLILFARVGHQHNPKALRTLIAILPRSAPGRVVARRSSNYSILASTQRYWMLVVV